MDSTQPFAPSFGRGAAHFKTLNASTSGEKGHESAKGVHIQAHEVHLDQPLVDLPAEEIIDLPRVMSVVTPSLEVESGAQDEPKNSFNPESANLNDIDSQLLVQMDGVRTNRSVEETAVVMMEDCNETHDNAVADSFITEPMIVELFGIDSANSGSVTASTSVGGTSVEAPVFGTHTSATTDISTTQAHEDVVADSFIAESMHNDYVPAATNVGGASVSANVEATQTDQIIDPADVAADADIEMTDAVNIGCSSAVPVPTPTDSLDMKAKADVQAEETVAEDITPIRVVQQGPRIARDYTSVVYPAAASNCRIYNGYGIGASTSKVTTEVNRDIKEQPTASTPQPDLDIEEPVIRVVSEDSSRKSVGKRREEANIDAVHHSAIEDNAIIRVVNEDSYSKSVGKRREKANIDEVHHNTIDNKISSLQIRIDAATGNGSIIDVLRKIDPTKDIVSSKASDSWSRIKRQYTALADMTTSLKINGKSGATPTAPPDVLLEIAYVALYGYSVSYRSEVLSKLCESLSIDVSCITTLEEKYSSSGSFAEKNASETVMEEACVGTGQANEVAVRVNRDEQVGCIIDVLRFVDPSMYVADVSGAGIKRIVRLYPHIGGRVTRSKFPHLLSATDFHTLVEIAWYALDLRQDTQEHTSILRRDVITKLCELLGVDVSTIDKLKQANVQPVSTTSPAPIGVKKSSISEVPQEGSRSKSSGKKKVSVQPDVYLRIDKKTKLGSVNDVMNHLVSTRKTATEFLADHDEIIESFQYQRVNGKGGSTPLCDIETLLKICLVGGSGVSKERRMSVATQICDFYGEPRSLVGTVQKLLSKPAPVVVTKEEPRETRSTAAKGKRAHTPSTARDADPPAKRVMLVRERRESTRVCTMASVNAQEGSGAYQEIDPTPEPVVNEETSSDSIGASRSMSKKDNSNNKNRSITEGGSSSSSSSMDVVQGSEGGGAKANDDLLAKILVKLERVAQSSASEDAKKQLEQMILANISGSIV